MTTVSSTIRGILKWGGIALGSLVLIGLILFGVAYVVNLRDEPLTPEARALMVSPRNPYNAQDNIYLALVGFDAPAGESPVAVGRARVERYNHTFDRAQRSDPLQGFEMMKGVMQETDPRRLQFTGELEFKGPISSYWEEISAHRANVEKLKTDNMELYERYVALHRQAGYFETCRPGMMAPFVFGIGGARKLFLADAVLRMRSDDRNGQREALADLEDDVRLWHAVLIGEGALVSKMVAIAYLHWDELLLAEVIADAQAPVPVGASDVEAVVPAFPLEDWNIGESFRAEFLIHVSILEQARSVNDSGWSAPTESPRMGNSLGGHFFKFNATENLFAEQAVRLMREAASGARPKVAVSSFATLRKVYNPVGKIIFAISEGASADYGPRAWDGAAFHHLLRLSYEIRRQRTEAGAIPAFLAQHPEWSTHPANGRPFLWDEKAGTLRVQPVAAHPPNRPFFLHVWRPATRG